MDTGAVRSKGILFAVAIVILIILFSARPIVVIPAGTVGVKDFFGYVSKDVLSPGIRIIVPFTKVVKMSVRTLETMEEADTPSREGLIIKLDVSLLYRIDPLKASEIYKTIGKNYQEVIVQPQLRSTIREVTASYDAKALYSAERDKVAREIAELYSKITKDRGIITEQSTIREVTASYDAKALYSAERDKVAREIAELYSKITKDRGIITEQLLLRKIGLPTVVANAIQEKLKREQEAEQMKFVLQKELQEAERKRIEAQGIADFQKIITLGLSPLLLEWKGIEATEKIASSQNTKVVIIGNSKNGLPIILGSDK